jgi:hypothetical protein
MDITLNDNLFFITAIIFYSFLCIVYLLRAFAFDKLELILFPVFSFLLIPFVILWTLNLLSESDSGRLIAGFPIILYLAYDLWYRVITKKKPHHHPEHWPMGLIIYLILLQVGSIALNWYGYIVSEEYGRILVICYFIMLGCFCFYQYKYSKRKKTIKVN